LSTWRWLSRCLPPTWPGPPPEAADGRLPFACSSADSFGADADQSWLERMFPEFNNRNRELRRRLECQSKLRFAGFHVLYLCDNPQSLVTFLQHSGTTD